MKRREELLTTSPLRGASGVQTRDFKDFCAFIQKKTGSKQVWSARYRDTWNRYLSKYGIEVMIGLLIDREFHNVEYTIKALKMLDTHEQTLYIQACCRERYHEERQKEITKIPIDERLSAMVTELADGMKA